MVVQPETLTQNILTEKQKVHDPNIKQKSSDYNKTQEFRKYGKDK